MIDTTAGMAQESPDRQRRPLLIIFAGLPGVGKTTIARALANRLTAVHLRIDSIEDALPLAGPLDDAGYRVAYAVAEDNLRAGQIVIADCVNPIRLTRDTWLQVAGRLGVAAIEIEVTCLDTDEHRRRVESRTEDQAGVSLTWNDVASRDDDPWDREHFVIDTSAETVEESVNRISEWARGGGGPRR